MHIEVLVEDASGACLLEHLIPKVLGPFGEVHTWRVVACKGVGRLPPGLGQQPDPAKRLLLHQLPRLLAGYGRTPGIDALVVVLDTDDRDCRSLLAELRGVLGCCDPAPRTVFRLAIEEVEAWYFGDRQALLAAYPRAKPTVLKNYVQDGVCGTWELLADAIYPGGSKALERAGWPLPGQTKYQWAQAIGPHLDVERNQSPSFARLRDGLRRMTAGA